MARLNTATQSVVDYLEHMEETSTDNFDYPSANIYYRARLIVLVQNKVDCSNLGISTPTEAIFYGRNCYQR